MLTIHVWPKWLKEFLLTHPLYKSPWWKERKLREGSVRDGRLTLYPIWYIMRFCWSNYTR